jgi:hypothetical protein
MDMKTKGFLMVAMFISYVLWTHGVWAETKGYIDAGQNSTTGIGVLGARYDGTVNGQAAIFGLAYAPTGQTWAGQFTNFSTSGTGVFGSATATSGKTYGGWFTTNSITGIGVRGTSGATSGTNYGGWFQNLSTSGFGVFGFASATTGNTFGGYFQSYSTSGRGVEGWATATSGTNYGVYGGTSSPSGYGVYSKGNMMVEGNFTVTGKKSAVVKLKDGKGVSLYAVESSENWFEDFGSSKLKDGKAVVQIEPTFAETVNTGMEYHVFLTPKGDCRGLYVTNEAGTSFEVRELNGGKSATPFSYRIVAKRKGYEDQRLAKVDVDETTTVATGGEAIENDDVLHLASHVE